MRFKYDRAANRKSKVFTDVDYQLEISLPLSKQQQEQQQQVYELYAIVIHSGYSSDGGHYYTYGRDLDDKQEQEEEQEQQQQQDWFIFNDSKVSFSSWEEFCGVSKRFSRDTAYQLFYKKKGLNTDLEVKRPLRADLKMAVEKDNVKFLREKERQSAKKSDFPRNNKDDDDNSGGNFHCGGNGFGSLGGRLVF